MCYLEEGEIVGERETGVSTDVHVILFKAEVTVYGITAHVYDSEVCAFLYNMIFLISLYRNVLPVL